MHYGNKDIIVITLASLILGIATGFGFGHFKNIRYDIMMRELAMIEEQRVTAVKQANELSAKLGDVDKTLGSILKTNGMEFGCTKSLNSPNVLSTAIATKPPNIGYFTNFFTYRVKQAPICGDEVTSMAILPYQTNLVGLDLIVQLPFKSQAIYQDDTEICWMVYTAG